MHFYPHYLCHKLSVTPLSLPGLHPLLPAPIWQHLGFYLDANLSFHAHIKYYADQALTTIRVMLMLGNPIRSLLPIHC